MRNKILLGAALSLLPLPALAHVTLAEPTATPGANYVAHFRVGHGCDGSPTTALSVTIPDGVSNVDAQPQPGWQVATVRMGGRITAVTFKGSRLDAKTVGEFAVAMRLPRTPGTLAFPAVQTCEKGEESWSQMPMGDTKLKNPAPLLTVAAAGSQTSALTVSDGWMRMLPGNLPAGGYFTLKNSGTAKVTLTGAASPGCGMLMLHKSEDTGGMSSMADVTEVDVAGGGSVSFAPGGYHLMCMSPTPAMKRGASLPVTLTFRGAAPLTAQFDVRGATGK